MNTKSLKIKPSEVFDILRSIKSRSDIQYQGFKIEDDAVQDCNITVSIKFNGIWIETYISIEPPYDLLGAFYYDSFSTKAMKLINNCILWSCIGYFQYQENIMSSEFFDDIINECERLENMSQLNREIND